MKIKGILEEFKQKLEELYGDNLIDVILYGSYARGEEKEDSDIDLAIVIKGEIRPFKEIDKMTSIAGDIDLKYNVLLSLHPISEIDYFNRRTPLLTNIREEGILI